MKSSTEVKKTLLKSEVIEIEVKISKEKWDNLPVLSSTQSIGNGGEICVHISEENTIEGTVISEFSCLNCEWEGGRWNSLYFFKSKEGKMQLGFNLIVSKEDAENFDRKVSVKVQNACKTVLHADLEKNPEDEDLDELCVNTLFLCTGRNEFPFQEMLNLQVTVTTTAKENNKTFVEKDFVRNLRTIRADASSSDIVLLCNDQVFSCHKNILSAQSRTFKNSLTGNTKENREKRIVIKDSSPRVVDVMLDYLYSGEIPSFPQEFERDLLHLADMYELLPLKEACGESIVVNMNENNFLVAITEIDRYFGETSEFKDQAKRFLKSNLVKIAQNKEAWQTFVAKFPALFQDILVSLA